MRYREALKEVVGQVIRLAMSEESASQFIHDWSMRNLVEADRQRFNEMCETELLHMHEGNFARYLVRPSEFARWQRAFRANK